MIKTVKLDKKNNYLLDSSTGEKLERYDPNNPNILLVLTLDHSVLNVNADKIQTSFGNIVVQHNEDKYIIDDGYQNILVKAGYVIFDNYDEKHCWDKVAGDSLRSGLLNAVYNAFNSKSVLENWTTYLDRYDIITYDDNFKYTINIDTVTGIVAKNHKRKENSLPFFPFEKSMDKYGTVYVSIYAQKMRKIPQEAGNDKYRFAEDTINKLVKKLGSDLHKFYPMPITKRVIYWK